MEHSIFILCLEMAVFSWISDCYINKSVDFSRQLWFCIFFSPCACWGQHESQPHCQSPGGMRHDADLSTTHPALEKARGILGSSPWVGLSLSYWIKIIFICINFQENVLYECILQCSVWRFVKASISVILLIEWKVSNITLVNAIFLKSV